MEISVEELLKEFNKIKMRFDFEERKLVLVDGSQEAIEFVAQYIELFSENFRVFAKQASSVLHPNEFVEKVAMIPGWAEVLQDKLEYLIKNLKHNSERMLVQLSKVDGIDRKIASDFEKFYKLYMDKPENEPLKSRVANSETANPLNYNAGSSMTMERLLMFINSMYTAPNGPEALEANKDIIFCLENATSISEIVKILVTDSRYHDFIRNNFEQIRDNCSEIELVNLYKAIQVPFPEEYAKKKFVIEELYDAGMAYVENKDENSKTDKENLKLTINQATNRIISLGRAEYVESLLKTASPSGDIDFLGVGGFNMIVKAGEKAFKFGTRGKTTFVLFNQIDNRDEERFEIPYHLRLVRPIIRKRDVGRREDYSLYIEVQDELDTTIEITDEELLQVYKELREAGIKWYDVKKENLGRLKKPNAGYDGYNVPLPNSHLGIKDSDAEHKILGPGELVVLDLDFIYTADTKNVALNPDAPQIIKDYEEEFQRREKEALERAAKAKEVESDGYGQI